MAKVGRPKKVTTTTVSEEVVPDENGAPVPAPVDEIQAYFKSLGHDNLLIKIFRQELGSGNFVYETETDMENANENYMQENFGPGKYQIRAYKDGQFHGSKVIRIGKGVLKSAPAPASESTVARETEYDIASSYQSPFMLQLESIREDARTNRELLMKVIENMNHGKSSTMELVEVMTMLNAMKPAGEAANPMKMFSEMIPFVRELMKMMGGNPPEEEEKGWLGVIKQVAGELPNMLKMIKPASSNIPAPGPILADGQTPFVIQPEMAKQLQLAFSFLKGRVRVGADPLAFVDFAMNTLDMEQSLNVVQLLDRSYEEIAVIDPEIMSPVYRPWFTEFFKGLKDAINERSNSARSESDGNDAAADEGIDSSRGSQ